MKIAILMGPYTRPLTENDRWPDPGLTLLFEDTEGNEIRLDGSRRNWTDLIEAIITRAPEAFGAITAEEIGL